ncbi:hypothetical protein Q1695_016050 [Nippostrongylus brasiliensis]|nr:hypothetical protein Q1695_016050 [Nippostrongylus brasiliensis]
MAAAPQRFPLPNMPFRREIHSGCAFGTSITCTAQAFKAKEKCFTMQMSSAKDIAVLVTVPIAKNGHITASARIDGKFTSEVEKPIIVPLETKFTICLRFTQYVVEIFFNNNHVMDFVHRVPPADIKEVFIEGPLIVEEVVFSPPQGALLDPLPSYQQATESIPPVAELQYMSLGPSGASQPPVPPVVTAAPSVSSMPALQPVPGPPAPVGISPSIVNQPIAGIPPPPLPAGSSWMPTGTAEKRAPSLNPFEEVATSSNSKNYENTPKYVPTAFQQAQAVPTSSTPTPYIVTSPTPTPPAPYPPDSVAVRPFQPMQFSNPSAAAAPPPPQVPYPTQMPMPTQPNVPGAFGAMPMPQSYPAQQQQYPYPAQTPYAHPHYAQVPPGVQMPNPYMPYQQPPPQAYPYAAGPYAPQAAYAPQYYGNYPTVQYGSGCHSYRRSSSCCSD